MAQEFMQGGSESQLTEVVTALTHTLTLWRKLTRFLEYPELDLSNNRAEKLMRPIVVG